MCGIEVKLVVCTALNYGRGLKLRRQNARECYHRLRKAYGNNGLSYRLCDGSKHFVFVEMR